MKKIDKKKLEKIIDKLFIIGVMIFMIIAGIHIIRKDYDVSSTFVFVTGIFIVGILINLIIKAKNIEIETWKKRTMITIYSLEIVYLIYCVITKDFKWFLAVVVINFMLESLKKQESKID